MTLTEIAEAVGGVPAPGTDGGLEVIGPVTADSRAVAPGGLFAAFAGLNADGHDFAAAAVQRGAAAVLASRPVDAPAVLVEDVQKALGRLARAVLDRLRAAGLRGSSLGAAEVLALTGSSGKTSTKDLLGQVLAGHPGFGPDGPGPGAVIAPKNSYNNELGLPLTVLGAGPQTRFLVLEMGSRGPGHIRYLCEIAPPSTGIVLNVGSAHIGEFGSKEKTALAKGELVESLAEDGLAVLNADDPLVSAMRSRTKARVVTFGESREADVRATGIEMGTDGCASFTLAAQGSEARVALQLVGEHHVSNALAVAAAALGTGMSVGAVAERLSAAVALSGGRMAVSERADGVVVIDDAYNANPESVGAALKSLALLGRSRPGARSWAVLGPMLELGERSDAEHEAIGRLVVRLGIDRLVAVGEGAASIHTGAAREGSGTEGSAAVSGSQEALDLLRAQVRPGDVVLVKASNAAGLRKVAADLLDAAPNEGPADQGAAR
ncbi:MAG TPA: UDP-N-acetylmuramoyl-tripeptide--D-alanyl-D-alanine ligase [Actinocrinis sp.]|jgi:UDP-N-acetylmuramoyl-tripeptide--D-alanyl-D-alanine ligase